MARRRKHRRPNEARRVAVMSYDISDYVDVKTRIELLYKKFENASIQFEFKGVMEGNPDFIWGIAYVYRQTTAQRLPIFAELCLTDSPALPLERFLPVKRM